MWRRVIIVFPCAKVTEIYYIKKKSPSELQNNYLGTFIIVCQTGCFFFQLLNVDHV